MTLIPYMLGRLSAAVAPHPADAAGRYGPGAEHRPVAALVAVGLPAALLVAVALSPIALPTPKAPPHDPPIFSLPKPVPPPPPPDPKADPVPPDRSVLTAPQPPLPPVTQNPLNPPVTSDPPPLPADPVIGTAPPTVVESVPAPVLVAARPDPRFAASFQPDYPPFEQRNEMEGVARVRVLVGTDGRVQAVEDLGATSPGFFAETKRRALSKWRFKPALRGDVAEESWVTMTVRFRLER
jgi:protein TonB